jgi:indole-3-acetate O-methyltransferase
METFLNARAQELVNGGLLVIIMSALQDGVLLSQSSIGMTYDLLGPCLQNMAKSVRLQIPSL